MNTNIFRRIFVVAVFASLFTLFLFGQSYSQEGSTATGLSRAFNPAIGVNGLFLGTYTDLRAGEEENTDPHLAPFQTGLHIQEVELGLMSVVDPYLRAQITLAMHNVESIEIEEAYVQTTNLPRGFGLQAGKFFLPFGKQNRIHTHALPFIDGPWINNALLGHHGLNDIGVQLSYLTPLPWYSELTIVVFDPGDESVFVTPSSDKIAYMANWRNLWDLTPRTSLDWGVSWAGAQVEHEAMHCLIAPIGHHHHDENSGCGQGPATGLHFFGTDITFKHVSTHYRSWDVSAEYIQGIGVLEDRVVPAQYGGVSGYARFQVSRRWWIQGRGDVLGLPMIIPHQEPPEAGEERLEEGDTPWKLSGGVALVLSEFTAIRLQYDYTDRIIQNPENRVMLQLNVTIGAHPAHSY